MWIAHLKHEGEESVTATMLWFSFSTAQELHLKHTFWLQELRIKIILSCNELTLKKTFYDDLKVSDQVAFTNCFGHGNPFWATVHVWVWTPPRTHTAWSVCSGAAPSMKSSARD